MILYFEFYSRHSVHAWDNIQCDFCQGDHLHHSSHDSNIDGHVAATPAVISFKFFLDNFFTFFIAILIGFIVRFL